ncbi:hypothetical protein QCO44_09375 [Selenomonas sputigena]|uniref:Uncharacterized protein n=1 Tax=Selenomonas sputigena TaxID=69823 RepID=A0ABV3X6L0_9FIRM
MPDKQMKLQELLRDLAKDDTSISEHGVFEAYIRELRYIYSDDFRHLYSDVFGIITGIDRDSAHDLSILSRNINALYKQAIENNKDGGLVEDTLCKKIAKLYDHVNLDIARIDYTRRIADELNRKHEDIAKGLESIRVKAGEMQKDYITILGIFSSIIITFVAGMAFSTSVLANIDKASIYRLVFIVSLLGMGLFNLVNLLLRFVQTVNKGYDVENDGNSKRIQQINSMIVFLILLDCIAWLIYWWRFG